MGLLKLERALQRGGVALRGAEGAYRVWRSVNRQRRALGTLPNAIGDAWRAEGKLRLQPGEAALYRWAGEPLPDVQVSSLPPSAIMGVPVSRRPPRTLLIRALETSSDERARTRLADAAGRFMGDVEYAALPHAVTMAWHRLATGRVQGGASGGARLPGHAYLRARGRLGAVQAALGAEAMRVLYLALVQELSAAALARRLSCTPQAVVEQVAGALCALAEAYDQAVKRG